MSDIDFLYASRMAKVGYICGVWANFEAIVAFAIWYMLKLDMETGKIVTGGLDMRPRANMAVTLARHLKAPAELTQALIDARKALDDGLEKRRNLVVHGTQSLMEDPSLGIEFVMHRGKNRGPQIFTDAALDQLTNDLTDAYYALEAVVKRHFRDAESIARKMRSAASETDSSAGS